MPFLPVSEYPIYIVDFNELVEENLVLLSKNDVRLDISGCPQILSVGEPVFVCETNDYGSELELIYGVGVSLDNYLRGSVPWTNAANWLCELDESGVQVATAKVSSLEYATGVFEVDGHLNMTSGSYLTGRIVAGEVRIGDKCDCVTNAESIRVFKIEYVDSTDEEKSTIAIQLSPLVGYKLLLSQLPSGTKLRFIAPR